MNDKKTNGQEIQDKEYKQYINKKIDEYNNNGRKTIVYFCDTFYPIIDGVIKVLDNYATLLSKDYNVVVVVPKHKNKIIVPKPDYLVIGVSSMFFKFVNYDLAFPDTDSYLKNTLKRLRIDLIHAHSPFNMGKFAGNLANKRQVPFVMTMHSQYKVDFAKYTKSEPIINMLLKNIIKVFNKSTEVWTMHSKGKETLASYGYKGKFFLLPNATDHKVPSNPQKMVDYINEKYNIAPDTPVFLFVGRLVSQKNIFFILDTLKHLSDTGLNYKMFFVGNGPDESELKQKIEEYNLTDKIILTSRIDNREELASYYQRSTLFLFPSTYDTSSIVQIESATYKTPAVFIRGCVTACTITDKQNGFLADENIESYANTILEAVQNKELLKTVSENAFRDLYITWEDVTKKARNRYEYLMEQNKNKLSKLDAVSQMKKDMKNK